MNKPSNGGTVDCGKSNVVVTGAGVVEAAGV